MTMPRQIIVHLPEDLATQLSRLSPQRIARWLMEIDSPPRRDPKVSHPDAH